MSGHERKDNLSKQTIDFRNEPGFKKLCKLYKHWLVPIEASGKKGGGSKP